MRKCTKGVVALLVSACCWCGSVASTAELRTWKAAAGGYTTEAEFVTLKPGDLVTLRLKNGPIKDIPLSALSAQDQQYVRQHASSSQSSSSQSSSRAGADAADVAPDATTPEAQATGQKAFKAVDDDAGRAKTPEEAVVMFASLLASTSMSPETRAAAEAKLAEWKQATEKGLVRLGLKWVSADEARSARVKSAFLIGQGLELVRLKQDRLGLEKLLEASRTDPDGIRADFIIATVYALAAHNYDKAQKHYEVCLRRDPANVAVLNNLALAEVKVGQHVDAVRHWKAAAALAQDERIAQNLGRLFDQAGRRKIAVTKSVLDQLSDVYANIVIGKNVTAASPNMGWQYMLIPDEPPPDESTPPASAGLAGDVETTVCANGFVVDGDYVLTTRSGTRGGDGFMIAHPTQKGKLLPAKLVASCTFEDIAMLHCPGLNCPSIPIMPEWPVPGTEVRIAAYSATDPAGTNLKMVTGTVRAKAAAVSNAAGLVSYLAMSPSLGGGPVVDSTGNVVAMHWKPFNIAVQRYGAGVSSAALMAFARLHVGEVGRMRLPYVYAADHPWSTVERDTARSAVVISCKRPGQDVGLAQRIGPGYLVDQTCCRCNGAGKIDCPVRACKQGVVPSKRQYVARDTGTGASFVAENVVGVKCNECNGDGLVRCSDCKGEGIDLEVKNALRKVKH